MKRFNKKGQVMQNLGGMGVAVAALVIVLAVTFLVMAQLRTQVIDIDPCGVAGTVYNSTNNVCCDNVNCTDTSATYNSSSPGPLSNAMNASQELTAATATIPGWVPLIILVMIGGIILAMVARFGK